MRFRPPVCCFQRSERKTEKSSCSTHCTPISKPCAKSCRAREPITSCRSKTTMRDLKAGWKRPSQIHHHLLHGQLKPRATIRVRAHRTSFPPAVTSLAPPPCVTAVSEEKIAAVTKSEACAGSQPRLNRSVV